MPTPQLPWFRFWKGATQHAKARRLSDGEFRTWIELLDLASQQKWRGRFSDRKDAITQCRRPSGHLTVLIAEGLVDVADDGHLTMHDWDWWQRWRKEDAIDPELPPDEPRDRLRDQPPDQRGDEHRNGHVIDTSPLREEEKNKRPIEAQRELSPLPPTGAERRPMPKPKPERTPICDEDIEDLVGKYAERYGSRQAVRDEIDAALNHTARFKALRERLYVDTWLRRELEHRTPAGLRVVRPGPRVIDRTGTEN